MQTSTQTGRPYCHQQTVSKHFEGAIKVQTPTSKRQQPRPEGRTLHAPVARLTDVCAKVLVSQSSVLGSHFVDQKKMRSRVWRQCFEFPSVHALTLLAGCQRGYPVCTNFQLFPVILC